MAAEDDGLGKVAGRWLKARVKEWTTTDRHEREDASVRADELERDARDKVMEDALLTAVPGLRRMKERQEAAAAAGEAERAARHRAELESRPLAAVELHLTGTVAGSWAGELPVRVEVDAPSADDVHDDGDDGDAWVDPDPYADRSTLLVDLTAFEEAQPELAGKRFAGWRFQVPGYTGDGTYDLAAIAAERDAVGASPEYIDWDLTFAGEEDDAFYFHAAAGPASVTVDDGGRTIGVSMTMSSAGGDANVSARITLP